MDSKTADKFVREGGSSIQVAELHLESPLLDHSLSYPTIELAVPERPSVDMYMRSSYRKHRLSYAISVFISLLRAGNNVFAPYAFSSAFLDLYNEHKSSATPWLGLYLASWIVGRTLEMLSDEVLVPVATDMSHELTNDVLTAYFDLPMMKASSSAGSEAVHHFGISYEQIGTSFVYRLFGKILPAVIELATAAVFIPVEFGSLAIIAGVCIFGLHVLFMILGMPKVANANNGYVQGLFRAYEYLISQVGRYENTHYFGATEREIDGLSHTLDRLDTNLDRSLLVRNRIIFFQSNIVVAIMLFFSALYHIKDPFNENLSPEKFIWLFFYLIQISPSFESLADAANKLYADKDSFSQLVDYLRRSYDEKRFNQPALYVTENNADLSFNSVFFDYGDQKIVLNDISFTVKNGSTVVLTGESGAGKSSIFKLIMQFFRFKAGDIRIAGQDIQAVNVESLRRAIAIVPQFPTLQNTTIYENIHYADPSATEEAVRRAAEAAGLSSLITEKGIDFEVGANGSKLSGGQRQRVAIARAYLRHHCPILLMDEPTSALDPKTEREILAELDKLLKSKPRTTLIISHRLSALAHLESIDEVIYLNNGKIAEKGTMQDLMQLDGLFARQMNIALAEETVLDTALKINSKGNDAKVSELGIFRHRHNSGSYKNRTENDITSSIKLSFDSND